MCTGALNKCLLKIMNIMTSAQEFLGSTIYTGIGVLAKTKQRTNTKKIEVKTYLGKFGMAVR